MFLPNLAILALQKLFAHLRRKLPALRSALENQPTLLVHHDRFLHTAMAEAQIAESDIWAKLRESNVHALDDVTAVVLETTGDFSILHSGDIAPPLMDNVRRRRE